MVTQKSDWYKKTRLGDHCDSGMHCSECKPDGDCDRCDTIDGRWIEAVSEYASTCDGRCHELTHHDRLSMDPETQLGYCQECIPGLAEEIRNRLERKEGVNC
jgi:hypothetical protein